MGKGLKFKWMIETQVGKVKTGHTIGRFTVIIP